MTALARWCLRRRLVVVVLWCAVLVGVATSAVLAGSAYSNKYDVPGTESGRANTLLSQGFPDRGGDSDTVVWKTGPAAKTDAGNDSVRDAEVRKAMGKALDDIAALPGVGAVSSPYAEPAQAAQQDRSGGQQERSGGQQEHEERISRDGRTAYATVTFDDPLRGAGEEGRPARRRRRAASGRRRAGTGRGTRRHRASRSPRSEGGHLAEAVGIAVAAVVLLLAFGSLAAMLLPIVTALVSVGTATLAIGLLSHVMTVADFAPMLGTLIGLGVGIDYALFIVTRHRRGLKGGLPVAEAAERAVASAGRAVVFAGVTVCIALLGMLVLRLSFLNGVAVAASLTVVLAVLASVTLLPALLGVIGMRALSRRATRPRGSCSRARAACPSRRTGRRRALVGLRRAPPQAARRARRRASWWCWRCPMFGLHLGTSDQGNNPATAPPGRRTTCSPTVSGPVPTGR